MDTSLQPLRVAVLATALALLLPSAAAAQTDYFWNSPTNTNWTAANAWQVGATTGPSGTWVNGNRAVFDDGGGIVGVTTHLTAVGLEFASPSVFVVGSASTSGASLTLTGSATITMSTSPASSVNATLAGGTIAVRRNAPAATATTLRLNGDNAFTGNLVVGAGGLLTNETNRVHIGTSALPATAELHFEGRNAVVVFERWSFPQAVPNNIRLNTSGSSGNLGNTLSATTVAARVSLDGVISGSGGLTFAAEAGGAGSVYRLTNANTYGGGTVVQPGATVLVNNPLSGANTATGTGGVNVGGRVGGTGRIGGMGGPLMNSTEGLRFGGSGVVAPGDPAVNNGVGQLMVDRTINWIANGTYEVQLGGLTDTDADRDQLRTTGIFQIDTANANVRLAVDKVGSFEFTPGQTYTYRIAQAADGITMPGGFNPAKITIVPSFGTASEFSVAYENGLGFENYLVLNYTPVPEPGAVLGVCAAAVDLGGAVRRLRRRCGPVALSKSSA